MKALRLIVSALCLLTIASCLEAGTIRTVVYPKYADGSHDSPDLNPFAVYVEIDWPTQANEKVHIRVTVLRGEGTHFYIWNWGEEQWRSAYSYDNCPIVTLDASGKWSGWVFLKARCELDERNKWRKFKASVRKVGTDTDLLEDQFHEIYCMDMKTEGAYVHGQAVPTPTAGRVILAYDQSGEVIGSYVVEDNNISEEGVSGYPASPSPGYFRMAVPHNTRIAKLEVRDEENNVVVSQESDSWASGDPGSDTDLDALDDVSLPVRLGYLEVVTRGAVNLIRWETHSEPDVLGWNVYRLEREGMIRLNRRAIPSKGEFGGRYEIADENGTPSSRYVVEWIGLDGDVGRSKPIKARLPRKLRATVWAVLKR